MKRENKYKWTKPKNLFIPKTRYIIDAWEKALWEGLRKIREKNEKD